MSAILARLRQPSSVVGVSAVVSALLGYAIGAVDAGSAITAVVGGMVAIILPDNTAAKEAAERAAAAAVEAARAARR